MCEWRSRYSSDYRCKVPAMGESRFCIFHEPGEKNIEKFKNKFYEQIDEEGPEDRRNSRYNFRGYTFPCRLDTVASDKAERAADGLVLPQEIDEELICNEVKIEGGASFYGAKISGAASFVGAEIGGHADFTRTAIEGAASFVGAKIREGIGFGSAKIEGAASFGGAEIREGIGFGSAKIGGDTDFTNAKIGRYASFPLAKIEGNVRFQYAEIGGNVNFLCAKIGGDTDFHIARIGGDTCFQEATIAGEANFKVEEFKGRVGFDLCVFAGRVTFESTTIPKAMSFELCEARGLILGDKKPTIACWVHDRQGVTLKDVPTGYKFWEFARRTYGKAGDREKADAAYYFERVWRRKAAMAGAGRERLFGILGYPLELLLLRLPIAYGTSIFRTLASWFVVILAFCIVYATIPSLLVQSAKELWTWSNWVTSLYFSVTSFTTLGLGDIQPARLLGKALISLEAVLGGFLMALTVVVISRKFMR